VTDGHGSASAVREQLVSVEIDGRRHDVRIEAPEPPWAELARRHKVRSKGIAGAATGAVTSPMQGTVLSVAVAVGVGIQAGELICVVEAMKMENELVAHRDGVIAELHVAPGQQVALGDIVCVIDEP
jgi:acetyl-CoA/propionyl-CoA carboxylase biotin carboxyl carrier protein